MSFSFTQALARSTVFFTLDFAFKFTNTDSLLAGPVLRSSHFSKYASMQYGNRTNRSDPTYRQAKMLSNMYYQKHIFMRRYTYRNIYICKLVGSLQRLLLMMLPHSLFQVSIYCCGFFLHAFHHSSLPSSSSLICESYSIPLHPSLVSNPNVFVLDQYKILTLRRYDDVPLRPVGTKRFSFKFWECQESCRFSNSCKV